MARLVFLSCHLTGTGHLVRTLTLARAALARGHRVTVISGGRPLDHLDPGPVEVIQLPPVMVQGFEFTTLRQPGGTLADPAYMASRQDALEEHLHALRPDALITELFPFGRRVLADEFLAAIAAARAANPDARIVCSVRDIPEPKPKRIAEAAGRLRGHYDAVLVHGDAAFVPLSKTWPMPTDLAPMIHHAGYVGRSMPTGDGRPSNKVLVSVGGGVLGRAAIELAVKAAGLSQHPWHVLVGGADAARVAGQIMASGPPSNLTVEPARPDYRRLLANAGCSVSLCGYNTAVELAACHTPAIVIPSEEADEQEQLIRARHLASAPGIILLRLDGLTPETLATTVDPLVTGPRRPTIPLMVDDGHGAIERLEEILKGRP